jgi:hypothetical protein
MKDVMLNNLMSPTVTNDLAAYSYYVFEIETIHAQYLNLIVTGMLNCIAQINDFEL